MPDDFFFNRGLRDLMRYFPVTHFAVHREALNFTKLAQIFRALLGIAGNRPAVFRPDANAHAAIAPLVPIIDIGMV